MRQCKVASTSLKVAFGFLDDQWRVGCDLCHPKVDTYVWLNDSPYASLTLWTCFLLTIIRTQETCSIVNACIAG